MGSTSLAGFACSAAVCVDAVQRGCRVAVPRPEAAEAARPLPAHPLREQGPLRPNPMGLDPRTPKDKPRGCVQRGGKVEDREVCDTRVPEAKKTDTGREERLMGHWSSLVTHCVRHGDKSFARVGSMCLLSKF